MPASWTSPSNARPEPDFRVLLELNSPLLVGEFDSDMQVTKDGTARCAGSGLRCGRRGGRGRRG